MRKTAVQRLYPELGAGGFTRNDPRVAFFARIQALVEPEHTVVDYGAGRGRWAERLGTYPSDLRVLKGKVARLVGVDIDDAVLQNDMLDERHVLGADGRMPLDDASVDLIYSMAVFEHVEDPAKIAAEFDRVLKPGGWMCAWTPNIYGYVAIGARLVPNRLHVAVLRRLGLVGGADQRQDHDVFPTVYKLNSLGAVRRAFPSYSHHSFALSTPEGYAGSSMLLAYLFRTYNWLTPASWGSHLHIFCRKPD